MWAAWASTALLWPHPSPQINIMLSLGLGRWCRSPLTPGMAVLQGQPSWHSTGFWMSGEQGEPEGHQSSSCIPPPHSQSSSPAAAAASHTEMLLRQVSGAGRRGVKPCLWKRGHRHPGMLAGGGTSQTENKTTKKTVVCATKFSVKPPHTQTCPGGFWLSWPWDGLRSP